MPTLAWCAKPCLAILVPYLNGAEQPVLTGLLYQVRLSPVLVSVFAMVFSRNTIFDGLFSKLFYVEKPDKDQQ